MTPNWIRLDLLSKYIPKPKQETSTSTTIACKRPLLCRSKVHLSLIWINWHGVEVSIGTICCGTGAVAVPLLPTIDSYMIQVPVLLTIELGFDWT